MAVMSYTKTPSRPVHCVETDNGFTLKFTTNPSGDIVVKINGIQGGNRVVFSFDLHPHDAADVFSALQAVMSEKP